MKLVSSVGETSQAQQSRVGHLSAEGPGGLLQSLSIERGTGVLSVEHKDLQFRALFDQGRITHAKLGKINGNGAVVEFVSAGRRNIPAIRR